MEMDRPTTCNLHKKGDPAGVYLPPFRGLSQFLPYKKKFNCFLWCNCCVPFLWWNESVFIRGDSGYFPCWMEIRYLSHWVRSFHLLIMDRLLRDNGGVVIMHNLSFLIHGVRIMETGHFSFYMSFWVTCIA